MPCRDDWPDDRNNEDIQELRKENAKLEAMLCAMFHTVELLPYGRVSDFLDIYDESKLEIECGVTSVHLNMWWKEHQKKDAARKLWEQEEAKRKEQQKNRERIRGEALSKLTLEERAALGFS